jgi:hypothetical protein
MKGNVGSTWGQRSTTIISATLAIRSHKGLNTFILNEQGRPLAGHKWLDL